VLVALAATATLGVILLAQHQASRTEEVVRIVAVLKGFASGMAETADRSLSAIDMALVEMKGALSILADSGDHWQDWPANRGHTFLHARKLRAGMPQVRDFALYDRDGWQLFHSSMTPAPHISVADRPYFEELKNGSVSAVYGPYRGRNTITYTFAIAHRLEDRPDAFSGVLFAGIEPDYFRNVCEQLRPDPAMSGMFVNLKGIIVAACNGPGRVDTPVAAAIGDNPLDITFAMPSFESFRSARTIVFRHDLPAHPGVSVVVTANTKALLAGWHRLDVTYLTLTGGSIAAMVFACLGIAAYLSLAAQREADLRRNNERLKAADAAKSRFLATISHEIRTPMTGIIGMADFLIKTPLNDDQKSYVDTMRASAKTLLTILNDILDYSKIDADKLTLDVVNFDAGILTEETVRLFWPKAVEQGCSLSIAPGDRDALPRLKGDPVRIKQVLGNLVSNAVKFTKNGTIVVRLRHEAAGAGVRLIFEVEDTGIGISAADLANLFAPFSQAGDPATREQGGTGLGLAISKRLAEQMGGEIVATSTPGRGSLFRFTCLVQPGTAEGIVASDPQPLAAVPPLTILVVDDNAINRRIVTLGLEQRHHLVTAVGNGAEACEMAARQRFDLILMDMQMPVMDGVTATRRIRALPPPGSKVPIVALTADALAEHRASYMDSGLTDILTKPIEWDQLDAVLARLHGAAPPPAETADAPLLAGADSGIATLPLVDAQRVLEFRGMMKPQAFDDLILDFISSSSRQLSLLESEMGQNRIPASHGAVHAIKGMFLNIGGVRVATIAGDIQRCDSLEAAESLFTALKKAIDDTTRELERLRAVELPREMIAKPRTRR